MEKKKNVSRDGRFGENGAKEEDEALGFRNNFFQRLEIVLRVRTDEQVVYTVTLLYTYDPRETRRREHINQHYRRSPPPPPPNKRFCAAPGCPVCELCVPMTTTTTATAFYLIKLLTTTIYDITKTTFTAHLQMIFRDSLLLRRRAAPARAVSDRPLTFLPVPRAHASSSAFAFLNLLTEWRLEKVLVTFRQYTVIKQKEIVNVMYKQK